MKASEATKRFHDPNCESIAEEGSPQLQRPHLESR